MNGRRWTADELQVVRERYGTVTCRELAARLGRPLSSTYEAAAHLQLTRARTPWPAELLESIRRRHAEGWLDSQITAEWNAEHPDRPIDRRTLAVVRLRRLGLPRNSLNDAYRETVRANTRRQCEQAGVGTLAEVRTLAYQASPRLPAPVDRTCRGCGNAIEVRW